ncbi:MAG: hypothetical protein ACR2PG_21460 [Hyphomicrobiaceae bacterium]
MSASLHDLIFAVKHEDRWHKGVHNRRIAFPHISHICLSTGPQLSDRFYPRAESDQSNAAKLLVLGVGVGEKYQLIPLIDIEARRTIVRSGPKET